jgi:Zn-dependent protease with chaperone function
MEFFLSDNDQRLLDFAKLVLEKWRSILNIDPIWKVDIEVLPDEDIEGSISYINMSCSANYYATICISCDLLAYDDDKFLSEIEMVLCHELIHLMTEDLMRTAILAARNDKGLARELRHKCEQFTSRLQKTLMDLITKENE